MTLSKDYIRWAYRLFLDREPEDDSVLNRQIENTRDLRTTFMTSREFKEQENILVSPKKWVICETAHDFRLRVHLADQAIGIHVLLDMYEPIETAVVKSLLKPGDRVVDIGANIGYFTMLMGRLVGPKGHVLAFEPVRFLFDELCRSVAENGFADRVSTVNAACADQTGQMQIRYSLKSNNFGGAHLLNSSATPDENYSVDVIDTRTLDSYLDPQHRVCFVKIDVEGAELKVFQGGVNFFRHHRPTILSEIHPAQLHAVSGCSGDYLINMVKSFGYRCVEINPDGTFGTVELDGYSADAPINVIFVAS